MNPIEFQRKWIGVERKERSSAQEHFLDIWRVLDHPTPVGEYLIDFLTMVEGDPELVTGTYEITVVASEVIEPKGSPEVANPVASSR